MGSAGSPPRAPEAEVAADEEVAGAALLDTAAALETVADALLVVAELAPALETTADALLVVAEL
jgi:hypothetical protein